MSDAMDWTTGGWTKPGGPEVEAEIVISGDWAPIRAFDEIVERAPEAVYGNVLPVLRDAGLRITNLECPLTGERPVWKSGAVLKGRPAHVRGLTAVPFEIVTLANNHVFDYGRDAFRKTQELLAANGVRSLGAGMSAGEAWRPLIIDLKGIPVGLVNFSEGEDLTAAIDGPGVFGWEIDRAADEVRELRKTCAVVIAIGHAGVEYIPFPPPYVADAFRRLAEAGADLVIGHHPHVPQGIEVRRGVPICYSLGNFVFYQETDLLYRKVGYLVKAGVGRGGLGRLRIVPYEIGDGGLRLLDGGKLGRFMAALEKVSRPLADEAGVQDAWHGFLRRYGYAGFKKEIDLIMKTMADEPRKGAAMFRNRLTTPQHFEHWRDGLTRVVDGTIGDSPDWACELANTWLTEKR